MEPEIPGLRESKLPMPETAAAPFQMEEPVVERMPEPPIPEFKVSPVLEDRPVPNLEIIPKEPSPMSYESEVPEAATNQPSPPLPQVEKPAISTEQEMEMMRETLEMESEMKPPKQTREKPAGEASGGEEKHFFWE